MNSYSKNNVTIEIGGATRKLTFGMLTQEMYLNELAEKQKTPGFNPDNPLTLIILLFYCGLVIGDEETGSLPEGFSEKTAARWIDDCEDIEGVEMAKQFALTAMGFISSAESLAFKQNIKKIEAAGVDLKGKLAESLNLKAL